MIFAYFLRKSTLKIKNQIIKSLFIFNSKWLKIWSNFITLNYLFILSVQNLMKFALQYFIFLVFFSPDKRYNLIVYLVKKRKKKRNNNNFTVL